MPPCVRGLVWLAKPVPYGRAMVFYTSPPAPPLKGKGRLRTEKQNIFLIWTEHLIRTGNLVQTENLNQTGVLVQTGNLNQIGGLVQTGKLVLIES